MVQIAVALLYITFLCWTYGHITIYAFKKISAIQETQLPSLSIVCMTGLSSIAVIAAILSLFIPLGGISVQISLLLAGGIYWGISKKIGPDFSGTIMQSAKSCPLLAILLVASLLLLLLVMGSSTIIHPDTLGYHAQTIQWIENYKVIPGLAHLHVRYGLQSSWYLLCALFSFNFTHTPALTFINTSLACWFVLFVTGRINEALQQKNQGNYKSAIKGLFFFLFLVMSCWDFGQLRLTAVSASPDFAAAVYLWLVFYLLVNRPGKENETVRLMLVFFFSTIVITIKLSSAPVLLVSCYVLYRFIAQNRKKVLASLVVFALSAAIPFVARNMITTGYPVFPLTFLNLTHFDWNLDVIRTEQVKQYVTAYARIGSKANMGEQPGTVDKWSVWLPIWWNNRSMAERTMLSALLISLVAGGAFIRKIINRSSGELGVLLCVSVGGVIFWFVQAPDPRFGYGFIIPVSGVLLYRFVAGYSFTFIAVKRLTLVGMSCLLMATGGYTAYRFHYYFKARNLILPEGISSIAYKEINQQGIIFHIPYDDCECGSIPLPCIYNNEPFLMRGKKITDGFTSVKQPVK